MENIVFGEQDSLSSIIIDASYHRQISHEQVHADIKNTYIYMRNNFFTFTR